MATIDHAETNRTFVHAAQKLVVRADHTKWVVIAASTVATIGTAQLQ